MDRLEQHSASKAPVAVSGRSRRSLRPVESPLRTSSSSQPWSFTGCSRSTRSIVSSTSVSTTGTIFPGVSDPFVGWSNYTAIFHDPVIRTAAFNSFLFIVITVPIQMAIGLFAAAVLTDHMPGSMFWRACIYIPVVTSWVVVSWVFFLHFCVPGRCHERACGSLRRPYRER